MNGIHCKESNNAGFESWFPSQSSLFTPSTVTFPQVSLPSRGWFQVHVLFRLFDNLLSCSFNHPVQPKDNDAHYNACKTAHKGPKDPVCAHPVPAIQPQGQKSPPSDSR